MIELFTQYPQLARTIPRVALARLPTPVSPLRALAGRTGAGELWVKRDDLSSASYGGNKVRKLEFLLAAARARGATEVMTLGAAGSNHALATAMYARALGMRSISMLVPQLNAHSVRRNLLASWHAGAELHHYPDERRLQAAIRYQLARHRTQSGQEPHLIAGGGSAPLGCVGFVNAAFELAAQVRAGLLPEPDLIYLALGTVGTAAGLALGLAAAGLRTRLVPVRVVHPTIGTAARYTRLYRETAALLAAADPAFPVSEPPDPAIRHEFYGGRYGLFTPEAMHAVRTARETDGLELECIYTGKAFAALLADLREAPTRERCILFWNTYNSRPLQDAIGDIDYHELPAQFHRYFEEAVQPLDR